VRSAVEEQLISTLGSAKPSATSVAESLGISGQTLYRRLRAEGTTFEAVLAAMRHRLAKHWLAEKRMRVKDVAYRLGFSDPAAFSRAFKRWTGVSPETFSRN